MRKSKKVVQPEQDSKKKKVKKVKNISNKGSNIKGIILVIIAIISFVAVSGIIAYEGLHKDPVLKVGEKEYYLKDVEVMYSVYQTEIQNASMNSFYEMYTGTSIWDSQQTSLKSSAMENAVKYIVLYEEAVKNGEKLSDADKKEATETAKNTYAKMSKRRLRNTGFTEDSYVEYALKVELANQYYDKMTEAYNITTDSVSSEVKKEDYNERKIEYVRVGLTTLDEDSKTVDVSADVKKEYKAKMEEYLKEAKDGKAMKELVSEDDSTLYNYSGETTFIVGGDSVEEELEKAALTLKDGEVYDKVIEAGNYYYIVKMVDVDCEDSYNSALEEAVQNAINTKFEEEFSALKEDYGVETLDKGWSPVVIGSVTLEDNDELPELKEDETEATASPEASTEATDEAEATATTEATEAPESTEK